MDGECFYVEQHSMWEAKLSHTVLPGTCAVPLPVPKPVWLFPHRALSAVTGFGWEMAGFWHPAPKG